MLYTFSGGSDGREPYARLLFDASGNLYGTTLFGGNIGSVCGSGCGTVFKLTHGSSGWTESVLYAFEGEPTALHPTTDLPFDPAGNLYGSAYAGGTNANGTIFKLTPGSSSWTESVIHSFAGGYDGTHPYGDLILDATGNLYGTANQGGHQGYGIVFQLQPSTDRSMERKIAPRFRQYPRRKSRCRPGHGHRWQSLRHNHAGCRYVHLCRRMWRAVQADAFNQRQLVLQSRP